MNRIVNRKMIFLALVLFPRVSWAAQDSSDLARTAFNNSIQTQSANSTAPVGAVRDGAVTATPTTKSPSSGSVPSINQSANEGQSSQDMGKIINMAVGAGLMATCMASTPPNIPLCLMGALALAQGAADGGAAGQSGATASASKGTGAASSKSAVAEKGGTRTASNPNGEAGSGGFSDPKVIAGLKALKEAGYSVSAAGVKNPDGTTSPPSAFSSSGGMASTGMSPAAIKEAQKIAAALNEEISKLNSKMSASGVAEGAGGGGGSSSPSKADSYSYRGGRTNPFALDPGQRKQMVAGKTVLFDGDPIGVRGQDIFEMVHTAYEKKRQRSNFIEHSDSAPPMRAPASSLNK